MEQKRLPLSKIIIITAILSALVAFLEALGIFILDLETAATALALVPICLGAFWCGPISGAILGGVLAITVLFTPVTRSLFSVDPFATIVITIARCVLAGYLAGLTYKLLTRVNKIFASVVGSAVCSLVYTLIFLGGTTALLTDNLDILTNDAYAGLSGSIHWFWHLVLDSFVFEFALAIMLTPLAYLTVESVRYYKRKKYMKKRRHHHHRRPHFPNSAKH